MTFASATPGLTGKESSIVFTIIDIDFNQIIVYALMHVCFHYAWNGYMNLYSFKQNSKRHIFIDNGQSYLAEYRGLSDLNSQRNVDQIIGGVTGIICTVIADGAMVQIISSEKINSRSSLALR
ncbi:uncharacterized protein EV420DRAFT_1483253 [Desarmillaria tabescens]|uniref:Uncharacterized protein n=1 Tax=Armillaria tabescens TaxID=1929756 RepID=A0AA39MWX4_ARMTA|nr:uncharacterized protein EV420DRAFT_1483253 [Desarmillaria tabescens]KAK0449059.1 hypothetical protein EV420DRAFT_1483253 [Desarmillaria tabescens]